MCCYWCSYLINCCVILKLSAKWPYKYKELLFHTHGSRTEYRPSIFLFKIRSKSRGKQAKITNKQRFYAPKFHSHTLAQQQCQPKERHTKRKNTFTWNSFCNHSTFTAVVVVAIITQTCVSKHHYLPLFCLPKNDVLFHVVMRCINKKSTLGWTRNTRNKNGNIKGSRNPNLERIIQVEGIYKQTYSPTHESTNK